MRRSAMQRVMLMDVHTLWGSWHRACCELAIWAGRARKERVAVVQHRVICECMYRFVGCRVADQMYERQGVAEQLLCMSAGYEASPFVKLAREVLPLPTTWVVCGMQSIAGSTADHCLSSLSWNKNRCTLCLPSCVKVSVDDSLPVILCTLKPCHPEFPAGR